MESITSNFNNMNLNALGDEWEFSAILEERLFDYCVHNKLEKESFKILDVMDTKYHCFVAGEPKAYENKLWNILPQCFLLSFLEWL